MSKLSCPLLPVWDLNLSMASSIIASQSILPRSDRAMLSPKAKYVWQVALHSAAP